MIFIVSPPRIVGCGQWAVGSEEIDTAHYPLPTAHCPLSTAHCPPPTALRPPPTAHFHRFRASRRELESCSVRAALSDQARSVTERKGMRPVSTGSATIVHPSGSTGGGA